LDTHFKSIIKLLRQIVDSPGVRQSGDNDAASVPKRKRKVEEKKKEEEEREKASETFEHSATPCKSDDRSHDHVQPINSTARTMIVPTIESLKNILEMMNDSLATKVQITNEKLCKPVLAR